ncbi:hypothetical protein XA68_10140 [Ophiocordyceps unilateralis]|uniref:Uncharacterized protein n=1 Tax=Ophiocordyceps unilateralis TaxID=268505 RepID=A0A2A9PHC5_OPHUN|nr:hypothetical protein XA68_10140 [Ophiocordyceps unilateralis]
MSSVNSSSSSAYGVDDLHPELVPSTDPWGQYLSMRYRDRKAFFQPLDDKTQYLVRKELDRIGYLRRAIQDRKLFEDDDTPLVLKLSQARSSWNQTAAERCDDEIAKCKNTEQGRRDRLILEAVRRRNGLVMEDAHNESLELLWQSSEQPCSEEAADVTTYDPDKPDYGYNGWHLSFESGKGGVDNPLCYGQFPHQKIAIQRLLHDKETTPLKRVDDGVLRYFHLPANNMTWVEEAIKQYYGEEGTEIDAHGNLNNRSKTQRLLKHELWRGQQRGGDGLPAHARQIGARCFVAPCLPSTNDHFSEKSNISLFMPYLHWEIEKRLRRMSEIVQRKTRTSQQESEQKKIVEKSKKKWEGRDWYRGKFAELVLNWRIKLGTHPESKPKEPWKPTSPLAKYLWLAAKVFEIIDEAAEERVIEKHLWTEAPIHIRRTLNQFYHWTIAETSAQDQSQVVCRGTRSRTEPGAIGRVVMVDQLWMWILDENTILTSFPRRWGRNKPDPSAVHRAIRHHIGRLDGSEKTTIYDLALIIIDECSKVFFDRTKPLDLRPEVVAIFGSAISELAEMKTMIYDRFGRDVNTIDLKGITDSSEAERLLRKSLNINLEWSVLVEAQHIIDELQIMQEVFTQQLAVVRDFERAIIPSSTCLNSSTRERAATLVRDMEMRREELAGLEKLPTKTRVQQQAGIFEAKAAIQRADEAALQGRSIMVFTVFTIIFLPLSFFATVFGMNNDKMTLSPMSLGVQFGYMCKAPIQPSPISEKQKADELVVAISGALILVSLAMAFSALARTAIAVGFRATQSLKKFDKEDRLKQEEKYLHKRLDEITRSDKKARRALSFQVTESLPRLRNGRNTVTNISPV